MARTPMVTRTITSTKVTVMAVDLNTDEVVNITLTVPRTYKSDEEILKAVKKSQSEEDKAVHAIVKVVHKEVQEALYGMTEVEFIEAAKLLPPRDAGKEA